MKRKKDGLIRALIPAALVFALLLAGTVSLVGAISGVSAREQTRLVETAVRSAALTCYAVEGGYPQTIAYLKENYGLAYDEDRYLVIYDAFASNILPEIRVLERGAEP